MQAITQVRLLIVVIAVLSLSFLIGCAAENMRPKAQYRMVLHKELPEAERAVEAARQAGKDKLCPDEYYEAWALKEKAYETYHACRTQEAIEMALRATAMQRPLPTTSSLCFVSITTRDSKGPIYYYYLFDIGKGQSAMLDGEMVAVTVLQRQ